ncbi:MAG: hypothetical protein V1801_02445 [Candidatus Falkowbacteria bacterium]
MNSTGEGMGIDFREYMHNVDLIISNRSADNFKMLSSVKIVRRLVQETGLTVATEIMDPVIQLPLYEKAIPKGKLLIWNPAVNQLGYQMYIMGIYAKQNGWFIGIKNGKWFGELSDGDANIMEKNWIGQISFATKDKQFLLRDRIAMIHRGVDVAGKGKFRYLPVHDSAEKVKKMTGVKMFFDPSHSLGRFLRDQIVDQTILAMQMKTSEGKYLYDGILIEVGTSRTDTEQHITIEELQRLCDEVAKFRNLTSREQQF